MGKIIWSSRCHHFLLPNGLRAVQHRDSVFTRIHSDQLRSATVMTDIDGNEVRRLAYRAFGEEVQNEGVGADPKYTYTAKEVDASGLMYYDARYYDPVLCRFTTADTVYDTGPQGLNRYSYALNNPIIYRDPTGNNALPWQCMCNGNPVLQIMQPGMCIGAEIGPGGGGVSGGYIKAGAGGTGVLALLYALFSEMVADEGEADVTSSPAIPEDAAPTEPEDPKKPKRPPSGDPLVEQVKKSLKKRKPSEAPKGKRQGIQTLDDIIETNKGVNPGYKNIPGRENNCPYCVIAFDSSISHGVPLEAPPRNYKGAIDATYLEGFYGKGFQQNMYPDTITSTMRDAGHGSRGIVAIRREGGGHFINVMNWEGNVYYFDPQIGGYQEGAFPDYKWESLELLRTN